jgi:hypothetical protein
MDNNKCYGRGLMSAKKAFHEEDYRFTLLDNKGNGKLRKNYGFHR